MPKGLRATLTLTDNEHHVLRTRTRITKDGPLVSGREIELGLVEKI